MTELRSFLTAGEIIIVSAHARNYDLHREMASSMEARQAPFPGRSKQNSKPLKRRKSEGRNPKSDPLRRRDSAARRSLKPKIRNDKLARAEVFRFEIRVSDFTRGDLQQCLERQRFEDEDEDGEEWKTCRSSLFLSARS